MAWWRRLLRGRQDPRTEDPAAAEASADDGEELRAIQDLIAAGQGQRALERVRALSASNARQLASSRAPSSAARIALTSYDLGLFLKELGCPDEAAAELERARGVLEDLRAASLEREVVDAQLPACLNNLGILALDGGQQAVAVTRFEAAAAYRRSRRALEPMDQDNVVYLGGTLCNHGHALRELGRTTDAVAMYQQSIDLLDRTVPGCTCGCRDLYARMAGEHIILTAQSFLRNALDGRAACLGQGARFGLVQLGAEGHARAVTIEPSALVESASRLDQLRTELLDIVTLRAGPFVLDLSRVGALSAATAELLIHLRGRVLGAGEDLVLVGDETSGLGNLGATQREGLGPWHKTYAEAIAAVSAD